MKRIRRNKHRMIKKLSQEEKERQKLRSAYNDLVKLHKHPYETAHLLQDFRKKWPYNLVCFGIEE